MANSCLLSSLLGLIIPLSYVGFEVFKKEHARRVERGGGVSSDNPICSTCGLKHQPVLHSLRASFPSGHVLPIQINRSLGDAGLGNHVHNNNSRSKSSVQKPKREIG